MGCRRGLNDGLIGRTNKTRQTRQARQDMAIRQDRQERTRQVKTSQIGHDRQDREVHRQGQTRQADKKYQGGRHNMKRVRYSYRQPNSQKDSPAKHTRQKRRNREQSSSRQICRTIGTVGQHLTHSAGLLVLDRCEEPCGCLN